MNEKIIYTLDEVILKEYFFSYLPDINSFILESNTIRQFINNKVVNVALGIIFLILIIFIPKGTLWGVLNLMYLFMWMFIHSHYEKEELESFTALKMLINDPKILKKICGSAKETITQSHFQLLAQLASKEGYFPGMCIRIPALGKHGLKKAIQRLSADKKVKDVPLVSRDNQSRASFVPWHFEIEVIENNHTFKNVDRFELALDGLFVNMLNHEYKLMNKKS